jgi:CO dehydrogenase nickel-insertion accessory protein CooC1
MVPTESSGATFGGAVLNKVSNADQRSYIRDRLSVVSVPVIGIIDFNESIQAAALEGRPCPKASNDEIDRIAATLLLNSCDTHP